MHLALLVRRPLRAADYREGYVLVHRRSHRRRQQRDVGEALFLNEILVM